MLWSGRIDNICLPNRNVIRFSSNWTQCGEVSLTLSPSLVSHFYSHPTLFPLIWCNYFDGSCAIQTDFRCLTTPLYFYFILFCALELNLSPQFGQFRAIPRDSSIVYFVCVCARYMNHVTIVNTNQTKFMVTDYASF